MRRTVRGWGASVLMTSTSVASVYHYAFHWSAPYPWLSAPVLLELAGGVSLTICTIGLLWLRARRSDAL
ncbi:MAG: hypothetical protein ABJA83_13785 [Burkholderiaceae bacterium]